MRIITKRFKFSENTPKRAGASTSTPTLPKDGEINAKGMDKVMQLLVKDGSPNATAAEDDKYVDMSYITEARRTLQ